MFVNCLILFFLLSKKKTKMVDVGYKEKRITLANGASGNFQEKFFSLNEYEKITGIAIFKLTGVLYNFKIGISYAADRVLKPLRADCYEPSYLYKEAVNNFIPVFIPANGNVIDVDIEIPTALGTDHEFIVVFRHENNVQKPVKEVNYQQESFSIDDVSAQVAGFSYDEGDIILDVDYKKVIGITAFISSNYRNTFLISLLKNSQAPVINKVPFSLLYASRNVDFADMFLPVSLNSVGEKLTPRIEKAFASSPAATVDVDLIFKLER